MPVYQPYKKPPASFEKLLAPGEHVRFNEVLQTCADYLMGKLTERKLKSQLANNLLMIFSNQGRPPNETDRCSNLRAIQSLIRFLARIANGDEELGAVQYIADVIISIVQLRFGDSLPGFGDRICFDTISDLKRAFWGSLAERTRRRIQTSPRHKVIRINDIPFAESVYPALLSRSSNTLGYSVVVEDVEWTELGAALYNNRIDVAICNGPLEHQLKAVETLFDHKLIYKSEPLLRYRKYPVIRRNHCPDHGKGKVGIPWKSDFEIVAAAHFHRGKLVIPGRPPVQFDANHIVYRSSADDVLADVIDGNLEYGFVGGLQCEYAIAQFSKEAFSLTATPAKSKFHISRAAVLQDTSGDEGGRFWVAASRKDEAHQLLSAMTTLWNELVVQGWKMAIGEDGSELQAQLVDIVNGHRHRAFVKDFTMLRNLIETHDDELKPVGYDEHIVSL